MSNFCQEVSIATGFPCGKIAKFRWRPKFGGEQLLCWEHAISVTVCGGDLEPVSEESTSPEQEGRIGSLEPVEPITLLEACPGRERAPREVLNSVAEIQLHFTGAIQVMCSYRLFLAMATLCGLNPRLFAPTTAPLYLLEDFSLQPMEPKREYGRDDIAKYELISVFYKDGPWRQYILRVPVPMERVINISPAPESKGVTE